MKKLVLTIVTLILLSIYVLLFYLAGKAGGYFLPSLLVVVSVLAFILAQKLPTKKGLYDNSIYFNFNEFYFYFPIILIDIFSFFYYYNLPSSLQQFTYNNYPFLFLLFSIFIPSIFLFVIIYKNKKDKVVLHEENIYWTDNKDEYALTYLEIKSVELKAKNLFFIFPQYYILLKLNNDHEVVIATYKMNITKSGATMICSMIQALQSNTQSFIEIKNNAVILDKIEKFAENFGETFKGIMGFLMYFILKFCLVMIVKYIGYLIFS